MNKWKELTHQSQIDRLISELAGVAVVLKHSTRCSISAMVLNRLQRSWDLNFVEFYYLDLIRYREVSDYIADKFKVMHQSPQVIVLKNGSPIFDASHFDVEYDRLRGIILDNLEEEKTG